MLPWGLSIELNIREEIGASIWRTGVYEPAVSEAVWRLLTPGEVAIDAGANIGYMTSIMASRVGPGGKVIAFEPHPEVFASLSRNIRAFGGGGMLGEISAYRVALSNETKESWLFTGSDWKHNEGTARLAEPGEPTEGIVVGVVRLDDVAPRGEIALLKLDVEGHEAKVLRGATRLLSAGAVRNVIFEDHIGPQSDAHLVLRSAGYDIRRLEWNNDGLLVLAGDAPRMRTHEAANFIASKSMSRTEAILSRSGWEIFHHKKR